MINFLGGSPLDSEIIAELLSRPLDYAQEFDVNGGEIDTITGDNSNNTIFGMGHNDILDGGAGDDTLYGGSGNDSLTGGSGDDIFGFRTFNPGTDTIADFKTVEAVGETDALNLAELLEDSGFTALDNIDDFVTITPTSVEYDADGTGAGSSVTLATFTASLTIGETVRIITNIGTEDVTVVP